MSFISGTIDRICTFACGVLFAQIPQFIQHYIQYLAGRVDEAHTQIEKMRYAASFSHKSLEVFIEKFKASSDSDFSRQGTVMEQAVVRYQELASSLAHIESSEGVMQPLVFLRNLDWEIVKNTIPHLTPGLPITLEAGIYAMCGLFVGHFLFVAMKSALVSSSRLLKLTR